MVGLTSVGSGSLIIVLLLLLYPMLSAKSLVGTDLVQAIPLVGAATLGHLLFGDFQLGLTATLLVGAIPGVYLGAKVSTRAPGPDHPAVLIMVLLISALKLLGVSTGYLGLAIAGGLVLLGGWFLAAATGAPARRRPPSRPSPALPRHLQPLIRPRTGLSVGSSRKARHHDHHRDDHPRRHEVADAHGLPDPPERPRGRVDPHHA